VPETTQPDLRAADVEEFNTPARDQEKHKYHLFM